MFYVRGPKTAKWSASASGVKTARGPRGMPPRNILKSIVSEMPFPAFWGKNLGGGGRSVNYLVVVIPLCPLLLTANERQLVYSHYSAVWFRQDRDASWDIWSATSVEGAWRCKVSEWWHLWSSPYHPVN